jgi:hypothetical protein
VELCYVSPAREQVRITGTAEIATDDSIRREVWDAQPLLREWLGDFGNPESILYRIRPNRVRWMREWSTVYEEAPVS